MDPTDPFGNEPSGLEPSGGGFFSGFFDLFSAFGAFGLAVGVLVVAVFASVIGSLVYRGLRYAAASPQSAPAVCIGKRTKVSGGGGTGEVHSGSSTWYGATFQFADGSRRELDLSGRDYGLLAEGDRGMLTWRDTVFKGLDRSQASLAP